MTLTRRRFFGLGAVAAAVGIAPSVVEAQKPSDEAVGPILFEHVCDRGASRLKPEEVAEIQKEYPWMYRGCGTRFRWFFGMPAICPNCGYHYLLSLEDLKSNFYKRVSG